MEHYCCCPILKRAMSKALRLDSYYFASIHSFMLVNTHINTVEDLTTIALLIYGIYTTTTALRQQRRQQQQATQDAPQTTTTLQPPTENLTNQIACTAGNYTYDMLLQNIRNGAMGHTRSTYILDSRWLTNPPKTPIPKDFHSNNVACNPQKKRKCDQQSCQMRRTSQRHPAATADISLVGQDRYWAQMR
jgi:hypothetical protein